MATGTGWPFGGPWVDAASACHYVVHQTYALREGQRLAEPVRHWQTGYLRRAAAGRLSREEVREPISANEDLQSLAIDQARFPKPLPLVTLMAYSAEGKIQNLTRKVGGDGKMVERAAPGGEGEA